jgi:TetR/AcrR family transcriptional repressor of nem operon
VGLLEEEAGELTEPFAGCLYASYCYEAQLFTEDTIGVIQSGVESWRKRFADKLQAVVEHHPPRLPATAEKLSGMILAVFEGSFVLSKALAEPQYIAEQLGQYRNYLELLFAPVAALYPMGDAHREDLPHPEVVDAGRGGDLVGQAP